MNRILLEVFVRQKDMKCVLGRDFSGFTTLNARNTSESVHSSIKLTSLRPRHHGLFPVQAFPLLSCRTSPRPCHSTPTLQRIFLPSQPRFVTSFSAFPLLIPVSANPFLSSLLLMILFRATWTYLTKQLRRSGTESGRGNGESSDGLSSGDGSE
jgi:hypothetical protein